MVAYCAAHGIPPSRFDAWPEDDQDELLGFLRWEKRMCPGCHTHPSEWENNPHAYAADLYTCPGCRMRAQMQRQLDKQPEEYRDGRYVILAPPAQVEARVAAEGDG